MSMEVVAVRNLSVRVRRRTIRERLMNPPGGHDSSELEIISEPLARAARIEQEERRKGILREARRQHALGLLKDFGRQLETWIAEAGAIPEKPFIPRATVAQIIETVSEYYAIPTIHIMSPRQNAEFVRPRRMVMYLAREHTECSFPMIGDRLGGRDHTTIISGSRAIAALVADGDRQVIADIAAIKQRLGLE